MRGGTCLVSSEFDPPVTLARLSCPELRVSHYFCVPQMMAALRAQPTFEAARLSHLTAIFTGGAPHAAEVIRSYVREGLAVVDGYGMSEVGCVFGMPLALSVIEQKAGSVGFSTSRVQTRIVDQSGRDCPVGTPGELWVRSATVFDGYYDDPQETAAAFCDGWFCSGDIVRADPDGFHYVVDRKKDMFISGGENVYPAEIEACLRGLPELLEVAVVGVADARWGEVGHLVVVLAPDTTLQTSDILAYLGERLARFKVPRYVTQTDALPRTSTGKIQKRVIARRLRAASSADVKRD
jgi:fatty-acyl-CoA synthase